MFLIKRLSRIRERDIVKKFDFFLDDEKKILDVGCDSGTISTALAEEFGLVVYGIDLKEPSNELIHFKIFDGKKIPYKNKSFDAVVLIDVLHHIKKDERSTLMAECFRVAKKSIIIKDHYYTNFFEKQYLKFVDLLSNIPSKTHTPFKFISKLEWEKLDCCHKVYWTNFKIPNIIIKLNAKKTIKYI